MGLSIVERAIYILKLSGMTGEALQIATSELLQTYLKSQDVIFKILEKDKLIRPCNCKKRIQDLREAIKAASKNGRGRKLNRLKQDLELAENRAKSCECKGSYYLPNSEIEIVEVKDADKPEN
jgi:hypothetical protein